jgi:hypothetical protein
MPVDRRGQGAHKRRRAGPTQRSVRASRRSGLHPERQWSGIHCEGRAEGITPDARRVIEEAMTGKRSLVFLDDDKLAEMVKKHRLVPYLLFTDFAGQKCSCAAS